MAAAAPGGPPTPAPEPAPAAGGGREVIAGLVERVTYHNPENGFCVLRVKVRGQRDLVTVVGHAAVISAGEFVQASGAWVNDRTHGVQFKAAFLRAAAPTTLEGIERYLGSGMIKGIGPVYGRKLVAAFGEGVFEVIEHEPGRLKEVHGIGPKRAERIVAGWADLLAWSAFLLSRSDEAERWPEFYAAARALLDGRPITAVPIMRHVAAQTVAGADRRRRS